MNVVVTEQFLEDFRRQTRRADRAEQLLRDVAALRLVAERRDWRGWLARRWIARTQAALDIFGMTTERRQDGT